MSQDHCRSFSYFKCLICYTIRRNIEQHKHQRDQQRWAREQEEQAKKNELQQKMRAQEQERVAKEQERQNLIQKRLWDKENETQV